MAKNTKNMKKNANVKKNTVEKKGEKKMKMVSRETKKMFANAQTLGELKGAYVECIQNYKRKYAIEQINQMYINRFDEVKNLWRASDGSIYERQIKENASFFLNAMMVIKGIDGLKLEMDGAWVWLKGDEEITKAHKEELKSAGFWFCWKSRKQWALIPQKA